jgi:hypothetical protein
VITKFKLVRPTILTSFVTACILAFGISACGKSIPQAPPIGIAMTANGVEVTKLFQYDGCDMYRFSDENQYRYFAKCGIHAQVSSEYNENCGKNCTRRVITTVMQPVEQKEEK